MQSSHCSPVKLCVEMWAFYSDGPLWFDHVIVVVAVVVVVVVAIVVLAVLVDERMNNLRATISTKSSTELRQ